MADTQSILQLGIEAARAGNKTEARELFRLVTREDPNNGQGWLWLAGVAEDREEKRVALERVLQIEPGNQLAQKGLAALGGPRAAATPPTSEPRDTGVTAPLPIESRPDVSRAQATPPSGPATDEDIADAFDSIDMYASAPEGNRTRTYEQPEQVGGYVPPDFGDEDYDLSEYQNRPRVTAADIADRDRDTTVVVENEEPRRRGLMAWLPLVVVLLLLCLASFYVYNTFFGGNRNQTADRPGGGTAAETTTAETGLGGTSPLTNTAVAIGPDGSPIPGGEQGSASPAPGGEQPGVSPAPGGEQPGASPAPGGEQPGTSPAPGGEQGGASPAPAPGGEQPATSPAPGGEQPGASPAPAPGGEQPGTAPAPGTDVASANPAIVPNTQTLRAGDFEYTYSLGLSNFATGSYGGARPARGRYLIVLISVRNVGANPQQIPDSFFVVKDGQGRVSDFNRAASVDYINRFGGTGPGGAGDYAADAQLQPGAFFGSMPLLFDVAGDATDFVLFSRDNPNQGFRVR